MKCFSLLILVGIFGIICVLALPRPKKRKIHLKAVHCSADNASIVDLMCTFKPVRNKYGKFNFTYTFVKPVANLLLDVQSYIKGSANSYRKGAVHFTQTLCNLDISPDSFIMKYMPSLREGFSMVIQKCPYKGTTSMINYVLDSIEDTNYLSFLPTGDYKLGFQFIDVDKNKIILEVEFLSAFKGNGFNQFIA